MDLDQEHCVTYQDGALPLSADQVAGLAQHVPDWTVGDKSIERKFRFDGFHGAVDFLNRVAELAEEQDHHPDLHIYYNKAHVELSTHKLGGLSRNDFILAAKIDRLVE